MDQPLFSSSMWRLVSSIYPVNDSRGRIFGRLLAYGTTEVEVDFIIAQLLQGLRLRIEPAAAPGPSADQGGNCGSSNARMLLILMSLAHDMPGQSASSRQTEVFSQPPPIAAIIVIAGCGRAVGWKEVAVYPPKQRGDIGHASTEHLRAGDPAGALLL